MLSIKNVVGNSDSKTEPAPLGLLAIDLFLAVRVVVHAGCGGEVGRYERLRSEGLVDTAGRS